MPSKSLEIVNKLGLHARAAAKLTQVAGGFHSEIWISRSGPEILREAVLELVCEALPRRGFDPRTEVMTLVPMRRGPGDHGIGTLKPASPKLS